MRQDQSDKAKEEPLFVRELETGYVVIGDHQLFKGYTLFLSKKHARELHDVPLAFRKKFLLEMSLVAHAVYDAFKPDKLNYELLGNTDEHLHWHIFPRRVTDRYPKSPVWRLDKRERFSDTVRPRSGELEKYITTLRAALVRRIK